MLTTINNNSPGYYFASFKPLPTNLVTYQIKSYDSMNEMWREIISKSYSHVI